MTNFQLRFRNKMIGAFVLVVTYGIGSCMHQQYKSKFHQQMYDYFNSPQLITDFKQYQYDNQDMLVHYPNLTIYIDLKYKKNQIFDQAQIDNAKERECDFILQLFQQVKPTNKEKKLVLAFLKDENIHVTTIYRNHYAEKLHSTSITLKDCSEWYSLK